MLTGIRRFELQGLRWRDVDLIESVLRIRESKSEEGERAIALSPTLAEALWQHRRGSAFKGDDEHVFAHPERGSKMEHEWYPEHFRTALKAAGITDYVRPFHDARHASLTNGAAAGERPLELMARAGHRSMATTNQYVHLAGVTFLDAALALEGRLLGVELSTHLRRSQTTLPSLAPLHKPIPALPDRRTEALALTRYGSTEIKKLDDDRYPPADTSIDPTNRPPAVPRGITPEHVTVWAA